MSENNGFLMQIDEEKNGKRQRFLFLSIWWQSQLGFRSFTN